MGPVIGLLKGDTRSLDFSSCDPFQLQSLHKDQAWAGAAPAKEDPEEPRCYGCTVNNRVYTICYGGI